MASPTHGSDLKSCSSESVQNIESIKIFGNIKTKTHVIERELGFTENDKICESGIIEGVKRLKNIGLFSNAEYKVEPTTKDNIKISIVVTEKWTTIPILKFNSGGGVTQYTLGTYDPNLFGEFIEAGVQYENLAGAASGVTWFKNPRLFNQRQGIDLQYWNTRRIRVKYDQAAEAPEIKQGFLHERERVYVGYFREVATETEVHASIDYNKDDFSTKILPEKVIEKIGPNPTLPPSTKLVISKVGAEFGKIEGEAQSLSGKRLGVYFSYAQPLHSNIDSFTQGDISFVLYKPLSSRLHYAQRLAAGTSTTNILQYWYYLGGLDRIRGFSDNRFAGRQFALSNSEARYLFWEKSTYLIQGVGFLDLASIGEETSDLVNLKAASMGTGIRLILPKFYRFIVRLDFAKPLVKNDTMNWSFGVQQFF